MTKKVLADLLSRIYCSPNPKLEIVEICREENIVSIEGQGELFIASPRNHIFPNDPLFSFPVFETEFAELKNAGVDLRFYYEAVKAWGGRSRRKTDWKGTIVNWIGRDRKKGQIQMVIDSETYASEISELLNDMI